MRAIHSLVRTFLSRRCCRSYARKVTKRILLPQGLQNTLPLLALPAKQESVTDVLDSVQSDSDTVKTVKALQYSTVLQEALDNIQKYPECVLLTRVGGFYELYFNHAEELHQELGLKRSYRDTKLGPVAMAGFPFFQLDRYLKILVGDMGKHVAISDEFTRDAGPLGRAAVDLLNKNIFERRVSRIITPGTLIDEKFMETEQNNFLLALYSSSLVDSNTMGLAWMDLSTGDFLTQEVEQSMLNSAIKRIQPREIILASTARPLVPSHHIVFEVPELLEASADWAKLISTDNHFSHAESLAGSMLLQYVATNLPETELAISPPVRWQDSETMLMDSNALYSLEIRLSMREQSIRGSLLHTTRRTVTKSGTRLLGDWLVSPSTSIEVIDKRLDLVELLAENESLRQDVARFLRASGDAARVLQRFGFGRGEVDDLLTITKAIAATSEMLDILAPHTRAESLRKRLTVLASLRKKIAKSIDEVGLMKRNRENADQAAAMMEEVMSALSGSSDKPVERRRKAIEREMVNTMLPSATPTLKRLHESLRDMQQERAALELRLREETGVQTLTLKTLPGLSHIVHVKGQSIKHDLVSKIEGAKAVSATRSTRSFHVAEWSHLGTKIESTKLQIHQEESRTFHLLRKEVLLQAAPLRQNARVLDELDVASSFATLAIEHNWVRPIMTRENITIIEDGRHPVVEASLLPRGLKFTENSITFSEDVRMHLVTGTNMGGKSTYLRQCAVIQVLAQAGSYVPAQSAILSVKDAIYSRLGSNDDLYHGDSTFMLEMKECAQILKRATRKSLVLMDEVGRGTTFVDGTSLAYACLLALKKKGASVLFATHFHELADLMVTEGVGHLCTDLVEEGDSFWFSHKIRHGVCRDSHGLKVAMLAGVPGEVIDEARLLQQKLLLKQQMSD